eukprot:scaffold9413_cov129-Skeletonema_menzelii.AAC.9
MQAMRDDKHKVISDFDNIYAACKLSVAHPAYASLVITFMQSIFIDSIHCPLNTSDPGPSPELLPCSSLAFLQVLTQISLSVWLALN